MVVRLTTQGGLITCLLAFDICAGATDLQRYRRYLGKKLRPGNVSLEVWSNSLLGCTGYCSAEPDCVSLSWQQGGQTCLLSREDVTLNERIVFDSAGWITMCHVRYPVFHARRGGMRYNMGSMAEAETECQEKGTRLAAPSDLLDANDLGLEHCACGWLNDNTRGFVMHESDAWCGSTIGFVVCGSDSHNGYGNAWCLQRYP